MVPAEPGADHGVVNPDRAEALGRRLWVSAAADRLWAVVLTERG